jgi:hypothetical protein
MTTRTPYPNLDYARIDDSQKGHNCLLSTNEVSSTLYRTVNLTTKVFEEKELFLTDGQSGHTDDTIHGSGTTLTPMANNQKSLLIVGTYFLTRCLTELNLPPTTKVNLIFLGANPGDHLNNLAEMFPMIHFYAFDALEMPKVIETPNLKKYQKVFDVEDYMEIRTTMSSEDVLLLISGMRNKTYNARPNTEEEVLRGANLIISDMEEQKKWFYLMKPAFALLRFRPLRSKESKLVNRSSFKYLTGIHLLSPYSKPMTNTTMLMVKYDSTSEESEANYFDNDIVKKLKYHNIVTRNSNVYLHPFTRVFEALLNQQELDDLCEAEDIKFDAGVENHIMNCAWDCSYAYFVFSLYLKTMRGETLDKRLVDLFIVDNFSRLVNKVIVPPTETLVPARAQAFANDDDVPPNANSECAQQ